MAFALTAFAVSLAANSLGHGYIPSLIIGALVASPFTIYDIWNYKHRRRTWQPSITWLTDLVTSVIAFVGRKTFTWLTYIANSAVVITAMIIFGWGDWRVIIMAFLGLVLVIAINFVRNNMVHPGQHILEEG